ncbi:hypothetical protein AB0E54_25200 [Amycolatopsis coloradensis]
MLVLGGKGYQVAVILHHTVVKFGLERRARLDGHNPATRAVHTDVGVTRPEFFQLIRAVGANREKRCLGDNQGGNTVSALLADVLLEFGVLGVLRVGHRSGGCVERVRRNLLRVQEHDFAVSVGRVVAEPGTLRRGGLGHVVGGGGVAQGVLYGVGIEQIGGAGHDGPLLVSQRVWACGGGADRVRSTPGPVR